MWCIQKGGGGGGGVHRCQWTRLGDPAPFCLAPFCRRPLEVSSFVPKSTACALTACDRASTFSRSMTAVFQLNFHASHTHPTFIQLSRISVNFGHAIDHIQHVAWCIDVNVDSLTSLCGRQRKVAKTPCVVSVLSRIHLWSPLICSVQLGPHSCLHTVLSSVFGTGTSAILPTPQVPLTHWKHEKASRGCSP